MILTPEDTKLILDKDGFYSGRLTHKRWGYHIFKNEVSPYGNIIAFDAPLQIGALKLNSSFIIAIEIPNCNVFGSICFTRLFCAQLGSLISEFNKVECFVDGNCLIVNDKQCSITFSNTTADTALINVIISTCKSNTDILSPLEVTNGFKEKVVNSFHFLTKSIFIETQRDNF